MSFDQDQTIRLFYEVAVCYMHTADDNYVSISRQKDILHGVGMWYKKKPFTAPVGLCSSHPTLQDMMIFFRHPPPCEVDGMTQARDYDKVISNCRYQEKAYTALENIQYFPDRYISYI